MRRLIFVFIFLIAVTTFAQSSTQVKNISECVDTKADFPGGTNLFRKQIADHFRISKVAGSGIETCEITFIVERDGSLTNIKSVGSNTAFNEEAVRAVSKIKQKWTPAKICDQPVRMRFRIPLQITFN